MKGQLIATTKTFSIVSLPNWRISTIRGSAEYWRSEGEGLQYTNQLEERRKKHIIYVRAKYEDDPIHLSRSLVSTILPLRS